MKKTKRKKKGQENEKNLYKKKYIRVAPKSMELGA